ncbi:MAG TPA: ABC transporter ATP-binding protein [Burkholderiales bacterium]|nr:ABC transporter ATP-binding protein [Burkholderiales bacterium]
MASLRLRDVRKSFGGVEVLHGVDVEVADGELVVLVGPSGSGKTTLLRIAAGLEAPDAGEILLDGHRVNGVPPAARDVAMVFQQYALYPHMTVRENLAFALRMRGAPAALIAERVAEVAHVLGLAELLGRRPAELSGGQQQRVAIGRAIVRKPRVFLFDEPLSSLDGTLRTQMRTELKALHRSLGATSLYVTHDQTEAMAMAQRIVVLRAGRVEQAGTPLELYDRPANLFVAGFIGVPAMNLLPGRVHNGHVEAAGGARLPLARRLEEDREVVYGFRPEACALGAEGGASMVLTAVEPMGPAVQLYGRLGGTLVCAVTSERRDWRPGEPLRLAPDPQRALVFDPASGRAL